MRTIQEFANRIFDIDNETSATIIITLTVFIFGYLLNWIYRIVKAYNKRKAIRKLIIDLLKEISKTSILQAKNFIEFKDILTIEHFGVFDLKKTPINHLDNIIKIDFITIHDAFFTGFENLFNMKEKRKVFNRIWSHISTLIYWEQKYPKDLETFINKFNEYEDNRNENLERWNIVSDQFLQSLQGAKVPAEVAKYVSRYDKIVYGWQQSENRTNYHNAQEQLVNPLMDLNQEFMNISFVLQINRPLLQVTHYYDSMKVLLNVNRDQYWLYYLAYKKAGKILEKSIKYFKIIYCN